MSSNPGGETRSQFTSWDNTIVTFDQVLRYDSFWGLAGLRSNEKQVSYRATRTFKVLPQQLNLSDSRTGVGLPCSSLWFFGILIEKFYGKCYLRLVIIAVVSNKY